MRVQLNIMTVKLEKYIEIIMKRLLNKIKKLALSLTLFEKILWCTSVIVIIIASVVARSGVLNTIASFIGATSLIFIAKGFPFGQALTIVFCILYGIISWMFRYYGEMITYLCMTLPVALVTMISWIRHPYEEGKPEVAIARMTAKKFITTIVLSCLVTVSFYFILKALDTPNLIFSTLSVFTSFLAVSLMLLRSPYYALAYASNDVVLIVLWVLASIESLEYLPTVVCFVIFLANDIYGFINWNSMKRRQSGENHE